jgi:hypothetical protein
MLGISTVLGVIGCSNKRQIDPDTTNSFQIEGTSWYGFCQGRNAFIWVPSRNDTDPDELEAVIYDDFRCVGKIDPSAVPNPSSKPGTDPDGLTDDDND